MSTSKDQEFKNALINSLPDLKLDPVEHLLGRAIIDEEDSNVIAYLLRNRPEPLADHSGALKLCASLNNATIFKQLFAERKAQTLVNVLIPILENTAYNGRIDVFKLAYEATNFGDLKDFTIPNTWIYAHERLRLIESACDQGHLDIVKYIVESGFVVPKEREDAGPFFFAKKGGHTEVYEYLKETYNAQTN